MRPGIDREHLYVAMTRGREANHAFVATDGHSEIDHHRLPGGGTLQGEAFDVLASALARSGAQDAAHTVRDLARTREVEAARRAADLAVERAAQSVVPDEHATSALELTQRQDERDRAANDLHDHQQAAAAARTELTRTSRLRPGRRADLVGAAQRHDLAAHTAAGRIVRLDREITALTRQVEADAQTRAAATARRVQEAEVTHTAVMKQNEPYLADALPAEQVQRQARLRSEIVRGSGLRNTRALKQALGRGRRSHSTSYDRGRDLGRHGGPDIGL